MKGTRSDEKDSSEIELRPLVLEIIQGGNDQHHSSRKNDGFTEGKHASHYEVGAVGTANTKQLAVNIFTSFVGAGLLGMPFAFSQSGWILAIIGLCSASSANAYAMLLLVKTRKKLEKDKGHKDIKGYGDLGRILAGNRGEKLVNGCLVVSQVGFATAYIIFIAANLYNVAKINRAITCFGCVPILALLVQIQDMGKLSKFSLMANVSNLVGISAVLMQDYQIYKDGNHEEQLVTFNFSNLLYILGVSIYSLEGAGMVLPLESSYENRDNFSSILTTCIIGITTLLAGFGFCGYRAFGALTETPITLNLEGEWAATVKIALCVALYFTFPIMMFPVNEVMEDFFLKKGPRPNRIFRASVVLFSASIAYAVPNFGKFLSLVGSSVCTILGFILPAFFHLKAFRVAELSIFELILDYFLLAFGFVFSVIGTYTSLMNLINDEQLGHEI